MQALIPYGHDICAQKIGDSFQRELNAGVFGDKLPPWGKIWVRSGKVVCAFPSNPINEYNCPPLLFIDETLDKRRQWFFVGALAFRPLHAMLAVARYIQNLVVITQVHKEFWPPEGAPPRLHLRELNHPTARLSTRWKHIPRQDMELLFKATVPSIRELAAFKHISPVNLVALERAVSDGGPKQVHDQLEQL